MMSYIFGATIIVAVLGALMYCIGQAVDGDWRFGAGAVVIVIFIIAIVMKASAEEDAKGPCLKEETSLAWNAATKTMMPYTSCVERGTWTK